MLLEDVLIELDRHVRLRVGNVNGRVVRPCLQSSVAQAQVQRGLGHRHTAEVGTSGNTGVSHTRRHDVLVTLLHVDRSLVQLRVKLVRRTSESHTRRPVADIATDHNRVSKLECVSLSSTRLSMSVDERFSLRQRFSLFTQALHCSIHCLLDSLVRRSVLDNTEHITLEVEVQVLLHHLVDRLVSEATVTALELIHLCTNLHLDGLTRTVDTNLSAHLEHLSRNHHRVSTIRRSRDREEVEVASGRRGPLSS